MDESSLRLLTTAANEIEAGMISGILEQEGISYLAKSQGAGSIYHSGNLLGVNIYVTQADLKTAHELLEDFLQMDDDDPS